MSMKVAAIVAMSLAAGLSQLGATHTTQRQTQHDTQVAQCRAIWASRLAMEQHGQVDTLPDTRRNLDACNQR